MIPDPTDPTVWFISSAAAGPYGQQVGDATLAGVHLAERCAPGPCVVHRPSDHHMRSWRLNWRGDRALMERLCPHGVGHPDPDQINVDTVHGCDGCCRPPKEP